MTDTSLQRLNMVESQVRPSDVTDRRIIRAMREIAREAFVPALVRSLAYMDEAITVRTAGINGPARRLLAPRCFAKLVQLAEVNERAVVLDIGCATGYSTAVLARLARRVIGLEVDAALAAEATAALAAAGIANATVTTGALADGHSAAGPYDAIVLEGSVALVPPALLDQLKDGGRLVAILGNGPACQATVWQRTANQFPSRAVFDAAADSLPGFTKVIDFAL